MAVVPALRPYPRKKESGVEWLGEVPEHWSVIRLRQIGMLSKGSGGSKDDEVSKGMPCIRYGDLYTTHNYFIRESRSFITKDKAAEYTAIKFGDVLFAGSGETIDEIGKSAVNLMQNEAYCGGDVVLFRPSQQVEPCYLGYAMDCRPAAAQKATMGRGITVMHIYGNQLKNLTFPLPPLPEQDAIVRFLDHADRRIRRYIRAKQKLIALLEEQKQAIIHQAVTGQIDVRTGQPYPSYKDSGVEWLGEIPEHWGRRAVWQLFQLGRGKVTSHEYIANHPGPFPLYSSQTDKDGVMGYIDTYMFEGDYLTWTTDGAHAGTVFRRRGKFSCTNVCGTLYPRTQMDLDFMQIAVASETKRQVRLDINPKLMNNMMARIRITVPPFDEQEAITKFVQETTRPSDSIIECAQRQIDYPTEYRTRLIADVVTGKLDVRDAAAELPEEDDPVDAEEAEEDHTIEKEVAE